MKFYNIILAISFALLTGACADKDEVKPEVIPDGQGQYTDSRNGTTYGWVRFAGLEWMTSNLQYDTGDVTNCTAYQPYGWQSGTELSLENVKKHGYLYTLEGAQQAVPEGWRIPSDEDWQALESALGMSQKELSEKGWRGSNTSEILQQVGTGSQLNVKLSGYFTPYTIMGTIGYRFMGAYGFYWTSSADKDKLGSYYFYRKLVYNSGQVYRESIEPEKAMLSLRLVRNTASK